MAEDVQVPGPTRRRTVRVDPPQPVSRRKRTLVLSDQAWERLIIHAGRSRVDKSAIVEGWIHERLKRYVIQDRGASPLPSAVASVPGYEDLTVETEPAGETLSAPPGDEPEPGPGAGESPPGTPPRKPGRAQPLKR